MTAPAGRRGLLLFAHGARDAAWARPFHAVARQVRESRADLEVELGFLEFMSPDLATAGQSLMARGCTRIDVVPLFLGGGGHVRRDVPALLEGLSRAHPEVDFRLHGAAGESPRVVQALAAAALDAVDAADPPDAPLP
jgi:sirohydrochlorin cobaltochelatase